MPKAKHPSGKLKTPLFRMIPRKLRCKACEGWGKSSKGRPCVPCNGSGRRQP